MTSERFERNMKGVMHWECGSGNGYVNDKDDAGGETVYGCCRKFFPKLSIWKSLDRLNTTKAKKAYTPTEEEKAEVWQVYYEKFWKPCAAERYDSEEVACEVFDFAVNAGVAASVKALQRVLRISVDGIAGMQTVGTANAKSGVASAFRQARIEYYNAISLKGNNKKFLKGWLRRANECYSMMLKLNEA